VKVSLLVFLSVILLILFFSPTHDDNKYFYCKICGTSAKERRLSKFSIPYFFSFKIDETTSTELEKKYEEVFGKKCSHDFVLCGTSGKWGEMFYDSFEEGQKWLLRVILVERLFKIYTVKAEIEEVKRIYKKIETIESIKITPNLNRIQKYDQFKELGKKLRNIHSFRELWVFLENDVSQFQSRE